MRTSIEYISSLTDMVSDIETTIARHIRKNNLNNVVWNIGNFDFTLTPKIGYVEINYKDTTSNLLKTFNIYDLIRLLEQIEYQINFTE